MNKLIGFFSAFYPYKLQLNNNKRIPILRHAMMSNKFDHLLHILGVIMHCPPNQALTAKQLSQALGLSVSYVESLLRELRLKGLITSVRGPGGGYIAGPNFAHASAGDVFQISQGEEQTNATDSKHATPAHQAVAEIDAQLHDIKQSFLDSWAISNLFGQGMPIEFSKPSSKNGLGPAPSLQPIKPDAPNSIFDLARFQNRQALELRA